MKDVETKQYHSILNFIAYLIEFLMPLLDITYCVDNKLRIGLVSFAWGLFIQ